MTSDIDPPTEVSAPEDASTRVERPVLRSSASDSAETGRRTGQNTSVVQAQSSMHAFTNSRVAFSTLLLITLIPIGLSTLWLNPHVGMRWLAFVGLVGASIGLTFIRFFGARPEINERRYHFAVLGIAVSTWPLTAFYGPYMPFVALLGLVLLSYNQSAGPRWGAVVTLTVGVPHACLNLAITLGWIPDLSVLTVVEGSTPGRLLNLGGVIGTYVFAYAYGQLTGRRMMTTLSSLEDAVRQVAMRDAMLREARAELEEAAGIGQPGRFTTQRVGEYELGNILGRGGMGEVYEATHLETREEAAVKLIRRPEGGNVENVLARFVREAEIVASLDSPYVVRVLAIAGVDDVLPFIAMERLRGTDLAEMLRAKPRLSKNQLARLIAQVSKGLLAASAKNVVHRDLKPRNLFLTDEGTWKLLDFGVARLAGHSHTLTGGNLVGTPGYMAPEQLSADGKIDPRTDVHALGVVVYRAMTGRPAFTAKDVGALLLKVTRSLPKAPSSHVKVPASIDHVLRVALAKSPADRFADAGEFARSFRAAMTGESDIDVAARALRLEQRLPWGGTLD